jgi:nitroreductase
MDVEEAIRTRRTHKVYAPEPVERTVINELLELARWAPNHHLTNPWRFRVVGPKALAALKEAAGPDASKLDRAPTLIVASVVQTGDEARDFEDVCAAAVATYIVLLTAHARGYVGYWRTPKVLEQEDGRAAVGLGPDERVLGLIHLGRPRQDGRPPEREPVERYVEFLD